MADLLNQSLDGVRALKRQEEFEDVAMEAHWRAEMVEVVFEHLQEVLSKAEADLAKSRANWTSEKERWESKMARGNKKW